MQNSAHKQPKENALKQGLVGGVLGGIAAIAIAGLVFILSPAGEQLISEEQEAGDGVTVSAIDVADIVEQVNPAVVSIVITQDVPIIETYYEDPFGGGFGSPFRIPHYRERGTEEREVGGGSGFIVSEDGYIVTNAHVVDVEDAHYTVFLDDETSYPAEVVAADTILDIAVLKIEGENLPHLPFGDSDELRLGQGVIAIGNALGEFRNTVSTGVISGLARSIFASDGFGAPEQLENVIQTDAAINPGNSGGPLLNFAGEVIGVNVAVASGSENIGFSIPSNIVSEAVNMIREHGRVIRPYLGVRYIPVTPIVAEQNNLPVDYGALVVRGQTQEQLAVLPGSPADKAGIEESDIILEVNGTRVDEENELGSLLRDYRVGDIVSLKILREDEEQTLEVTLEEMPQ